MISSCPFLVDHLPILSSFWNGTSAAELLVVPLNTTALESVLPAGNGEKTGAVTPFSLLVEEACL
jgi:hypothetical protein